MAAEATTGGRMLFLALTACRTVTYTADCELEQYPIADDQVAADLTVRPDDVLEVVLGSFTFAATYDDGTQIGGEGEVVRGAGEAVVTDATRVTHRSSRGFGFGRTGPIPTSFVECDDTLEVPVDVWLRTADGAIELSFDGVAAPVVTRPDGEPEWYEVTGDVDPEDLVAMPEAPEPTLWPGLALQWSPVELHWVSLWWEGGDYVQILEGAGASE